MTRNTLATSRSTASRRVRARNTGGSLRLTGLSDFVTIPNIPALRPGENGFGGAIWLNLQGVAGTSNPIFLYNNGSYGTGWFVNYNSTLNRLIIYVQSGAPTYTLTNFWDYRLNKDIHFAFHVSSIDLCIRIYVDGALVATSSPITAWDITTTGDVRIGRASDIAGCPIGYFDDPILWVGEVADADIANLHYDDVLVPNAVCRYPFEEQTGTSAADVISGNTATLSGSGLWNSYNFLSSRSSIATARTAA